MAKSRNRTGKGGNKKHRKISQKRTKMLREQKAKAEKDFMKMIQKAQQEKLDEQKKESQKQEEKNIIDAKKLGDIGDSFEIEDKK